MIDRLENTVKSCPRESRLLGLDVGTKTIGLAVGDVLSGIATPVATIKRTKFTKDLIKLEQVIRDYEIGGYVVGYPLNMDGSEGPKCQSVRDFSHELESQISACFTGDDGLWIALYDERLSTASVESIVDSSVDYSRRKAKQKGVTDKLAAQVILQGALDYLRQCC